MNKSRNLYLFAIFKIFFSLEIIMLLCWLVYDGHYYAKQTTKKKKIIICKKTSNKKFVKINYIKKKLQR